MGYDNPDIYYNPDKFGLEIVAEVDWLGEAYEFDFTIILKDKDNNFYWARDSGCSCYSPFEYFTSLDHEDVHMGTYQEANKALDAMSKEMGEWRDKSRIAVEVAEAKVKIRQAGKKK